jgi:Fe-S cluster assembly protein SufB
VSTLANARFDLNEYKYGFKDENQFIYRLEKGLNREVVEAISHIKKEPEWMLQYRLQAYEAFKQLPMPKWGDLSSIDFDNIYYFVRSAAKQGRTWDEVPENIKNTFDRLGVPEAERKFFGGVSAQYESEVVYHSIREDLARQNILFCDMDTAVKEYPEIVEKYFGTVVPYLDNKFAALNTAVWSGGSFVKVPRGVKVDIPLQAYFRINMENMGQFERTLIICEPDSFVHYVEGCTAPKYSTDSLHAAVVEIVVEDGAKCRYTTIQNWSKNVLNLVTKRAVAYENATVEWVDGNLGSHVSMKYPCVYLAGQGAKADILSIALAGPDQNQDTGAKAIHLAPETSSKIVSKSISIAGGITTYRGLVFIGEEARQARAKVSCDALMFDEMSRSDTIPTMKVSRNDAVVEHEATVSKISEEQLFYLMSRGLTQEQATNMLVMGFVEPFAKELPIEYAVELNRLIEMEMEGSVG